MISKVKYLEKMLLNFLVLSFLLAAVHGDGKFAVLEAPDSIRFEGEEPISGDEVGDIVLAITGNTISNDIHYSGLSIDDPFKLPTRAIIASIEGISMDVKSAKFEAPLESAGVGESLDILVDEMKAAKTSTCDIDYSKKQASKRAHKCFGNLSVSKEEKPTFPKTKDLNHEDPASKTFLTAIADLNDAIDNYLKLKDTKDVEMRSLVVVRLSLVPIVEAYGANSAQETEAVDLVQNVIAKLRKAAGDALVITVSSPSIAKSRSRREAVAASDKNEMNLAKYYSPLYPVMFNIFFWFMIFFFMSLLAVSYAIGSMDPGKDSIIYRMTSTRMKKDN